MKRAKKALLVCLVAAVMLAVGIWVLGYYLTSDFRERRAVLEPLLASRAQLSEVEAKTHVRFTIWRRGTPEWSQTLAHYEEGSKWDRHIAAKMRAASAVGHTSTIDMQTWIFLDEKDRLTSFDIGTQ